MNLMMKHFRKIVIENLAQKQKGKCYVCDELLGTETLAVQFSKDPWDGGMVTESNLELIHRQCANRRDKHRRKWEAKKLRREGKTPKEIAVEMKKSLTSIYTYLKDFDVSPAKRERW